MRGLIHAATLIHFTTEVVDEFSQVLPGVATNTVIACRFFSSKDSIRVSGQSLYGETNTKVLLDGSATVSEGDQITSEVTGYTGTYKINSVTPAYARGTTPHNYTCTLTRISTEAESHSAVLGEFVLGYAVLGETS